jgi:hypothetical protein
MELRPSWEVTSHSATQEFHNILFNLKVHCYVNKSMPLVPIMSQMTPVKTSSSCFSKIHFKLSSHLCLCLPVVHFPFGFHTKTLYAFFFTPMHTTCPAHLTFLTSSFWLYLVKSTSYEALVVHFFLQHSIISSLFGPNILLNTLFSGTLCLCSSFVRDQVSHL